MIALSLVVLLAAQVPEFSVNLRTFDPRYEILGIPPAIDTDADATTAEWLVQAKHLFVDTADEVPDGPYAFHVLALRRGVWCRGVVFGWSKTTPDDWRVSGTRLTVRVGDVQTTYRLETPICHY